MLDANAVDYETSIPNNVGLSSDRRVLKALEKWHPGYLSWWNEMGPEGFQDSLVYLRTAVGVEPGGWAKFCLLYTSPSPRDLSTSRMPSSA